MNMQGAKCSAFNTGTGSTVSCTLANVLGRAQIVAFNWCNTDTTCTVSTASDTFTLTDEGNTYGSCQRLDSASGTDRRAMVVCHAQNILANSANTVQVNITSANPVTLAGLIVGEVIGGTASVTVDATGTLDIVATASPATVVTSGTTTTGNELIYTWANIDAGTLAVGQPIIGAMGTNYFAGQVGTPALTGGGTTALAQWNNASPRNTIKKETMSFNAPGFTLNPTQQQRGIIVTYFSPMSIEPTALVFSQAVNTTSASQPISIINTNTGNINLPHNATITGTNASQFAIASGTTCISGTNVGTGASCLIYITFTPTATGVKTATLSIQSSVAGSPHSISLTGTGV